MKDKRMEIQRIPAAPKAPKVLRVAVYARVSSDKDVAFHSLETQVSYYGQYVKLHPEWQMVDIYSDNAISGTTVERPEFKRMLEDCRAGKIDLVITKSITRFARNTVILLATIRELKALEIDVYFEKENLHSISSDGELLLTLLAMYAEEEARSASENQKWHIQKMFEQGKPWMGKMLGYELIDGRLVVVPEEAEIVKEIYHDFLNGVSISKIVKNLNESGILPRCSDVWNRSSVLYILTNEKYTGSMILQKTYCPDFRTKKRAINKGQVPMYEVTDSHEAIVSLEDYNLVQEKLRRNKTSTRKEEKSLFAGIAKCGLCGGCYVRRNSGKGKYKHYVWACRRYTELGKSICSAKSIREDILIQKTKEILGANDGTGLTREMITDNIASIIIEDKQRIRYYMKDGRETILEWQYKSRKESWTKEMREAARQKMLMRNKKNKENQQK